MKFNTFSAKSGLDGLVVARILIGSEHIEFIDQPFLLSQPATPTTDAPEAQFLSSSGFLMADLYDSWNIKVAVPIESDVPGKIGTETVLETVPEIDWSSGEPKVTTPPGPTIEITVGQAILALSALADMVRAGTLPVPPTPPPEEFP